MDRVQTISGVDARTSAIGACPKALLYASARRHRLGQTTVEFALICLPFFAILFCIVDFAQIFFYENSLQNALREAARFATAGRIIQATNADGSLAYDTNNGVVVPRAIPDPSSSGGGREASRNQCIRYWFLTNCVLHNFPISNIVITSAPTLPGVPPTVETNALGYLILVSGYNVTTNSGTVSTNPVPAIPGPGNANDYVQITADYQLNTITPFISYLGGYNRQMNVFPVHVSAIVKNEPALLNCEHTNMYPGEP